MCLAWLGSGTFNIHEPGCGYLYFRDGDSFTRNKYFFFFFFWGMLPLIYIYICLKVNILKFDFLLWSLWFLIKTVDMTSNCSSLWVQYLHSLIVSKTSLILLHIHTISLTSTSSLVCYLNLSRYLSFKPSYPQIYHRHKQSLTPSLSHLLSFS